MNTSEIKNFKFYRGDSIPGPNSEREDTLLRDFKTDGLMSKAVFDPKFKYDEIYENLSYYVAAHVGYQRGTPEHLFSKEKSPFLSFAKDDVDSAIHFMERTHEREFERCEVYNTEYALFSLYGLEVSQTDIGIYQFRYQRDYVNFEHIKNEYAEKTMQGQHSAIMTFLIMDAVIKANADNGLVSASMLIDVVTFLKYNPKAASVDKNLKNSAIDRAQKSNEWLIFGFDVQPSDGIISPRLTPNKFLKIEFRLQEKK